ncbi:MAG: hypothetical protein ACT4O3_02380 [Elusimicrobiota bacterium]
MRQILRLFEDTDYLAFLPAEAKAEKVRRLLLQWSLRRRDVAILHGICRYTLGKLGAGPGPAGAASSASARSRRKAAG